VVYRSVIDGVFGLSGAGALNVASDQPLLLRARTYNDAGPGTYGVALPVVAADHLLSSTFEETLTCPLAFAVDHLVYTAGFSFSLDDYLNATNIVPASRETTFIGQPVACDSSDVDLSHIENARHTLTLTSGLYDGRADWFDLVMDADFPTAPGYHYTYVAPDGTRSSETEDPGPVVPVSAFRWFFEGEGIVTDLGASSFGDWSLDLEHIAASGCR